MMKKLMNAKPSPSVVVAAATAAKSDGTKAVIGSDGADALRLEEEGLLYELESAPRKDGKRVLVVVRQGDGGEKGGGAPLRDLVNLYARRSRWHLARHVAEHFAVEAEKAMGHLDLLLDQVERALASNAARPAPIVLDEERRKGAEELLRAPDLLARVAAALEALGMVGEERVKKLVYLVATSRLLAKPLSAILVAPLSSGKSELLDRVVAMMPDDAVEFLSRLTPQALFYAGRDHLAHKLIVVDEDVGATDAAYPIRSLQSRGTLRLSATVRGRIERFETRGPIALLSSTTRPGLDAETLSRCLELPLDDGPAQTRRVLEAQRRAWAGEAALDVGAVAASVQAWQDAQRLLEPAAVVIPFAARLSFPSRTARDRRDHAKLGSLIAAHALLHALQRARDSAGRIVATVDDYAAIYELVAPLVDAQMDGLSPRAAALYRHLARADAASVTRRDVASALGWSYVSALRGLAELVAAELAVATNGEKPVRYRLLDRSLLLGSPSLTPPDEVGA